MHSVGDANSPVQATWPASNIESITDADVGRMRDHTKDAAALFHDPEFPHSNRSIGSVSSRVARSFEPQWIPVRFMRRGWWKLFDDIGPDDLLQGSLGNCWFVAALAAMAEFPREVQRLFIDAQDITKGGMYTIRLFDHMQDQQRNIVIDEFIPCHPKHWWDAHGKPLFAKPNGNEAWVLLLEKAMAKMFGSYSALDGNNAAVAFRALTGEKNTFMWKKDVKRTWTKWYLSNRSTSFHCNPIRAKQLRNDELFTKLKDYDGWNFLMSVSMKVQHAMEHKRRDGLVEGHAYSILQVVATGSHQLVCLRNPWGNDVQWNGEWSDGHPIWKSFRALKNELRPEFKHDGIFWMSWEDFKDRWDSVMVCAKSMREGDAAKAHAHAGRTGAADHALSRREGPSRPPPLGSMRLPWKPDKGVGKGACYPDAPAKDHDGGKGADTDASLRKPCARGCGRPAFGSFPTCCNRCQGKEAPHARDCAEKAGFTGAAGDDTVIDEPSEEPEEPHSIDDGILRFDSLRILSDYSGDLTPCENGCGRPAFGGFTTCCTHCKGSDGPHARDCGAKAGLDKTC